MQRHPHFDLWLHDDNELAHILDTVIIQRKMIHEWPLSCVQRLQCANGRSYIYKVQSPPTVEPTFYQTARSLLLVATQALPTPHRIAPLLMEDIQAPGLHELQLPIDKSLALVDEILAQIAQIEGDLPAHIDITDDSHWLQYVTTLEANLHALVANGDFQHVTLALIDVVSAHSRSDSVLEAINGPGGYVHMDLRAENILMAAHGPLVLDWQRPIWGPVALDRLTLLESLGVDAAAYVSNGVGQLHILLTIGWFVEAARKWFPPGVPTYDQKIAHLIERL